VAEAAEAADSMGRGRVPPFPDGKGGTRATPTADQVVAAFSTAFFNFSGVSGSCWSP
jgi:hypothetical protein